jgi:hypothetical protein
METNQEWMERLYLHMEDSIPAATREPMVTAAA